jgi:hypothetical protein
MDAQAKEIKNKVMCEINSFAIVFFFFMIQCSLIKQQTAWSQGSSQLSIMLVSSPLDHSNM